MLGIPDFWIWLPYVLCLLSALLCVVYGLSRWNLDGEDEPTPDDVHWAQEQDKMEEEL
ncbi:MAG: hypothetical protein Kow0059_01960 [Candidatus Sumerlaeia bacterium]